MLDVDHFLQSRYPDFCYKYPRLGRPVSKFLRLLLTCTKKEFQQFESENTHLQGFDFVDIRLGHPIIYGGYSGIGAVLGSNPHYRSLFAPVFPSAALPNPAVEMLVHFYQVHFPPAEKPAQARSPFRISVNRFWQLRKMFPGQDYSEEFARLKQTLTHINVGLPTPQKHCAEHCEPGGIQ